MFIAETVTHPETLEIINAVRSFYEVAWNQLIWVLAVAGGIVVILIPTFTYLVQRRMFKVEEENIRRGLQADVASIRTDVLASIDTKYAEALEQLKAEGTAIEQRMEKKVARAMGAVNFIQAINDLDRSRCGSAAESFVDSAEHYLIADDQVNLQRTLRLLTTKCLPELDQDDLEDWQLNARVDQLVEALKKENVSDRYTDHIDGLNAALKIATKRKRPSKNT